MLEEMMKYDNGILQAATAFGKTVVCSAMIAEKKVNTLIILESSALLEQWKDALDKFFDIDEKLPEYKTKTGRIRVRKSLIGEGFDFPRLDTLIMATPVLFRSVVEQYTGRLNRNYAGKKDVIVFDYVDSHIPMFERMYGKRLKAYKQIGYEICSGLDCEKQEANAIFDRENYKEVFMRDLFEAEQRIVISSNVISAKKVYEIINMLKEKQVLGVEVIIVTWAPDDYDFGDAAFWMQLHEDMRQAGFFIKTVEDSCENFAVIDQEIIWYGNIHLLGKEKVEDNIMRVKDKKIAAELLELAFCP